MVVYVKFKRLSKQKYLSYEEYNKDTLYFCTDTKELYRGDQLLTDGLRLVPTYDDLPDFSVAADGIIYYVENTKGGYVLNSARDKWLPVIKPLVTDLDSVPEDQLSDVSATVGAVLEVKEELTTYVDRKVSNLDGGEL